jgi:hypothetical protein
MLQGNIVLDVCPSLSYVCLCCVVQLHNHGLFLSVRGQQRSGVSVPCFLMLCMLCEHR